MKRILTTIIAFALSLVASAQNYDVIEPELQKILNQKSNDKISINIVLNSQADNEDLNVKYKDINDKALKREAVIKELKAFSADNQNEVMSFLQAEAGNANVTDLKAHWLVNTINCTATKNVIYELSEQPGISVIGYNDKVKLISDEKPKKAQQRGSLTDNITAVGANQVWAEGFTGKGVTVAVLDSGVNSEHVDLADHLWDGGYEYPDHGWNFIDNNSNTNDNHGHGTHCAGTICGDGTSGTQTGMAPDATLMCIKVLGDDGNGTLEALVSGIEFAVEHGADILSISLGWTFPDTYVSTIMREMFENVLATGVIAAVAAGNDRDEIDSYPIPKNISAPGNCPPPWLHPDQQANPGGLSAVVSVGAVNYNDNVAYFSSQGPVTWQDTEWNDYPYDYENNIEIGEGWLHYDNGYYSNGVGGPDFFQWGVMFPAYNLQEYAGQYLTKVAIHDVAVDNPQLLIYYGGDYAPKTLVHVQNCALTKSNKIVEIELTSALPISGTDNIWVVMSTQNGTSHPASCSDNTGDPNGRWISLDGTTWEDLIDYGLSYTWMLRAYATDDSTNAVTELKAITDYEFKTASKETLSSSSLKASRMSAAASDSKIGLIRPDVSAPGVGIVSSAYDDNDGYLNMSGTSMATPCVAGVMALMLDKEPNLSPADICRILETTATKLEDTKSNLTGSGRINAYLAINEIDNIKDETPTTPTTPSYRNVLIEEFTGRSCPYCPDGHRVANEIAAANPGRVFPVNYHTSNSLSPTSYPNLNVTESTTLWNAFNVTGIPTGNINRNSSSAIDRNEWESETNSQLAQTAEVNISGQVKINEVTRTATITVEAYYTSNSASSTNYLTIMMLQDSIWGSQSGGSYNPEQYVDGQYCHMHTLRDIITSTWGDAIAPTTAGTLITKQYVYNIPEIIGDPNGVEVDLNNIYFLAFVTEKKDGTPTRPVLNVNKLENLIGTDEPIYPFIKTFVQEDVISCDKTKKFTANVVNGGTEVITSLKFEVKVAGGATTTEEWEGYLPAYENTNIDLFAEVPWGGAEVSAKIVEANGETFTFETSVMAFSEEWIQIELDDTQATEEFKLELAQDRFGNQITWKVIGHNDEVIANGGPYKMLSSSGIEVHEEYFTIPAGECARFIIEDNVGNGINGSFGNGYYKLYDSKGNILIDSDGDFGHGEEHIIYVDGNGEEQTPMVEINVTEVTTTSVNVSFTPAEECASYFIMLDTEANMEQWATAFGVPLEELIEQLGLERQGPSTYLWDDNIIPNTEYTIFVLSKDIEGKVIQLDKKKVTTLTPGGEGISVIDLQVEVTSNTSVYVVATPNEETAVYHYIIADKAYIESIGIDSTLQFIHNDPYALYDVDRWEWINLTENTEYYAIAQGKNTKGEWGEITIVEFVTTVGETPKDPVTPQSPLTFLYEGNDVTNSINNIVIEKEINASYEIQFDLVVGNNTTNDMNVVCEIENNLGIGTNYICWGSCYSPSTIMATNIVYAGEDATFNGHVMFIDEDWNELPKGTTIPIKYTFYDERNPSEKYVFNVNFIYKGEEDQTINYWTPDESLYANNMTVITTIEIEGEEQYNPNLELGAFCNGELRGSARLQYVDSPANRYECFLMVYGNSNDIITFQLYDHSTGKVSELTSYESIAFEVNATIGDVTNPYTVNFIGSVIHSRDLTSGWNWYSTYIINEGAEGLTNLETAVGTNGIQIKNQTKFVNQASGNWYGTLTSTAVEDMFMIQMANAHTLELEGYVVDPADYPITLGTNWKWISYPLASEMSVNEAFANANPNNGDYVKSQKGFAQYYDGLGWSGTLKTMTPGMGYMYQNTSGYAKTLVYPMANAKSLTQTQTQTLTYWDVDVTKYPMNMTVIAVVEGMDADYEVAAFCNGECRGSARPVYIEALGQSMIFMTIYGDNDDDITFRCYDVNTAEDAALNEVMTFEVNATHGDVMEPYVMTLSTMGIDETSAGFNIYPNPVHDKLYIETEAEVKEVVVYDVYGRVQNLRNSETQKLRNSIDVSDLNSGVYFVQIKTEEGNITKRFVKE